MKIYGKTNFTSTAAGGSLSLELQAAPPAGDYIMDITITDADADLYTGEESKDIAINMNMQ